MPVRSEMKKTVRRLLIRESIRLRLKSTHARPGSEEQHQFNKLFVPAEARLGYYQIEQLAEARGLSRDEAEDVLAHDLVHWERQKIMDVQARDEIIAYYREGKLPENIFETLSTSELYDYYTKHQKIIDALPWTIAKHVAMNVSEVLYEKAPSGGEGLGQELAVTELHIPREKLKAAIEVVFKDEYKRDLEKWTRTLVVLEQKGYSREEIVSLISQEPLRLWRSLARRLPQKHLSQMG